MKVRPLRDRVVVRRLEEETTTTGGILLPGTATEKQTQGIVVAVGSGEPLTNGERRRLEVEIGVRVLFSKYADAHHKLTVNGEELIILTENDISAVLAD